MAKTRDEMFLDALSRALEASGLKQSEVAAKAGISPPYMSDIRNGKRGGTDEVRAKIAAALGYGDYEAFLALGEAPGTGDGSAPLSAADLAGLNCAAVSFAQKMRVAAGTGAAVDEGDLDRLNEQVAAIGGAPYVRIGNAGDDVAQPVVVYGPALASKLGKNRAGTTLTAADLRRVMALRLGGDSMEPLLARNGIVIVDLWQNDVAHLDEGGVYVICTDAEEGEFMAKRLSWVEKGKTVAIESVNPFYPTKFRAAADVRLLGRVIWAWRDEF